jgi:hypothetical protein
MPDIEVRAPVPKDEVPGASSKTEIKTNIPI